MSKAAILNKGGGKAANPVDKTAQEEAAKQEEARIKAQAASNSGAASGAVNPPSAASTGVVNPPSPEEEAKKQAQIKEDLRVQQIVDEAVKSSLVRGLQFEGDRLDSKSGKIRDVAMRELGYSEKDYVTFIEKGLINLVKQHPSDFTDKMKIAQEVLLERLDLMQRRRNVDSHSKELRRLEAEPGKSDVGVLAEQFNQQLLREPKLSRVERWKEKKHGYGGVPGDRSNALVGGSKITIEEIQTSRVLKHTGGMPNHLLLRNVANASADLEAKIKANNARLETLINSGKDLSLKKRKRIVKKQSGIQRGTLGNLGASFAEAFNNVSRSVGAGFWHDPDLKDAAQDSRVKKLLEERNRLVAGLVRRLDPKASNYKNTLESIQNLLASSGDLLDQQSFEAIQNLIKRKIEDYNKEHESNIKAFNDRDSSSSEAMIAAAKDLKMSEANTNKYRVLLLVLTLATPFGALIGGAGLFNYIDIISDLLGPIFDGSTSFGDGIAKIVTNEHFGPLAKFAKLIHLDEGIAGVFKIPGISGVDNILTTVIQSTVMQETLNTLAPFGSSPILPIAILGLYSFFHADREREQWSKSREFVRSQKASIKERFGSFSKEQDAALLRNVEGFVKEEMKIYEGSFPKVYLSEFIAEAAKHPKLLEIFAGIKNGNGKELREIADDVKNPYKVAEMLKGNDKLFNDLNEKATIFYAARREVEQKHNGESLSVDALIDLQVKRFNQVTDDEQKKDLSEKGREIVGQEMIFKMAKNQHFDISGVKNMSEKERGEKANFLKRQIMETRTKELRDECCTGRGAPNSSADVPSSAPAPNQQQPARTLTSFGKGGPSLAGGAGAVSVGA